MPVVKSLEDLKRLRAAALAERQAAEAAARAQIVVGLGTGGIAAGARATLQAIREVIAQDKLSGVIVRQTGDVGRDSLAPLVQVAVAGSPPVLYGNVTPELARRIVREHVAGGQPLAEHRLGS